jgi:hypothetical protein
MKIFCIVILCFLSTPSFSLARIISKQEYVSKFRMVAIEQMEKHKIPASITLAQGILESGSGNSILAVKGKNHFGIKCHDWKGPTMFLDDDKKGECFRVYSDDIASYEDHSLFLKDRKRYSNLFELELTDYKGWAFGLKAAGYATNSKYPDLLIGIIEELKLYDLDVNGKKKDQLATKPSPNLSVQRKIFLHENKVQYIKAKKDDTFYKIANEFGLGIWQLYKYNDFSDSKDLLVEGELVYLQPKRKRGKVKSIILTSDSSLRIIAQEKGIRLNRLVKYNKKYGEDQSISQGETILLR